MSRREERDKKYNKKENKTIEHGAWSMEHESICKKVLK
jgi:hypothetical protein